MRKLIRLMFSQVVIISILLILQFSLFVSSVVSLSYKTIYMDVIFNIISLIVVIIIINRHSNPMYKIAWIIPILIFPLFGGLFYLFISGQRHTKMFFLRIRTLEKMTTKNYPQNESVLLDIGKEYPERLATVRYINNVSGLSAYSCTSAKYFSTGKDKWKELLCDLEKAEHYIFLEYFIIKKGVMWDSVLDILKRKAASGVDVRLLYDGIGSMTTITKKYARQLEAYGIRCKSFSPFTPFLSAKQNNRDHRKIVIIDGKVAYTGGVNLADEYINIGYSYGDWKDMSVKICGKAAFSFTIMFMQMWHVDDRDIFDISKLEPEFTQSYELAKGYVMPYSDIPQDKYQTGEFIYLDIINKAKKYIHITTPYLILDHEMVTALINAAESGIDVKIICPHVADHWYARAVAYSYYKELTERGVRIYEYMPGFIHGKTFCSDDEIAVVGSINLDYRSLYLHFECAAWFAGSDVVSEVSDDFNHTLKKCHLITVEDCDSIGTLRKLLNAVLRIFAPLM